ncbi:MAG: tetratricopeptide repeat protein [Acidobacteriaceae bacterium]|nr:tetratricopeptide repeat protein [Acidobacteriaceae bacterium]
MQTKPGGKQMSEEARLLAEGRQLLQRAARLITETSRIKVWVPLLCSFVLTLYYLYTMHSKAAAASDHPQRIAEAPALAAPQNPQPAASASPAHVSAPTGGVETDDNYLDIRKRAEQAHATQQFDNEAKLWQQFMDGAPLPQQACPQIAKAYEHAGEIDDSVQSFEKCMSLDPANMDTVAAFAHVLQVKGDFARAATLFRQCLSKDPKNLDAQNGLALIELKQDHLREAQDAVQKILRTAPTNTDALLIAGLIAWREGKLPDAERIFLRGAGLDDQRADFHAFLGRIAEAERRPQDALRQYERALALDPNDSDIAERRDRLQENR